MTDDTARAATWRSGCGHVECAGLTACVAQRTITLTTHSVPANPAGLLRERLQRSLDGRCENTACPSLHEASGEDCVAFAARQLLAALAAAEPGLDDMLGSLDEDDLMYDYPVSQTGEPMDPVLFVRWEVIAARLSGREP